MSRALAHFLFVLVAVVPAVARAEVDHAKAFEAHRQLMTGGEWVSTNDQGETQIHRHVASPSNHFVRIFSRAGDEQVIAVYGLDPESGQFTLWYFNDEGPLGVVRCTAYEDGKWTWNSKEIGPDGEKAQAVAISTREGNDTLKLVIERGGERTEDIWKRRNRAP